MCALLSGLYIGADHERVEGEGGGVESKEWGEGCGSSQKRKKNRLLFIF